MSITKTVALPKEGPLIIVGNHPNTFMDVTGHIETKINAMTEYKDEMRDFPHPRSTEALRAIAARWGSVAGLDCAEAFELIRSIRKR